MIINFLVIAVLSIVCAEIVMSFSLKHNLMEVITGYKNAFIAFSSSHSTEEEKQRLILNYSISILVKSLKVLSVLILLLGVYFGYGFFNSAYLRALLSLEGMMVSFTVVACYFKIRQTKSA